MMRMAGDAQRALPADRVQDVLGRLIGADVLVDVERDDVRVLLAADVVLRDLGAGNHQQIVELPRAARLGGDLLEIGLEALLGDRELAAAERQQPAGARQQIALHQDVIGDRDHVEPPRLAVQIDDLAQRQPAVAPAWCGRENRRAETARIRALHPHVQMGPVGGTMAQDLRPEVADVDAEDRRLPHRAIAARRRPDPAVLAQRRRVRSASAGGRDWCPRRGTRSRRSKPPIAASASRRTAKLPP